MKTNLRMEGHVPTASSSMNSLARACNAATDRRAKARGEALSAPSPVCAGKERAALRMNSPIRGAGGALSCKMGYG